MKTNVDLLHERHRRLPFIVRWWGEPDQRGKQKRHGRSFRHRYQASIFKAEKELAFHRGEPRDPVNVTLEELVADVREARLTTLSYATQIGYRNTIDQMLAHFGASRMVREIRQRDAETFIATRRRRDDRPGELSTWAKARHLIHCRAIFAAAMVWGYTDVNPFRVSQQAGRSSLSINPKGKPWQHITPDEFRTFMAEVDTPQKRAAYWLMYGCGLRAGEAYNIMVSNINLDQRRLHVASRSATADIPPFTLKAEDQSASSKERTVPIPEAAISDLTEAMGQAFKSGGLVVLTEERFQIVRNNWHLCREHKPWGGHVWRPWQNRNMMNNTLRNAKEFLSRAGIELTAPFTLHTLRKSFAQNHADAGTPPRTLAKLMGHTNTRVTMLFYNRVTDANERAAAEAMDRLLAPRGQSADVG